MCVYACVSECVRVCLCVSVCVCVCVYCVGVAQSLAFLPIMMGVLMFLFEFFEDQALAFMVFSVVWMSEVFGLVRCLNPKQLN